VFCDEYGAGVYYVLDCSGAGARREITRKPPPQVRFFTKFRTTTKDKIFQNIVRNFFAAALEKNEKRIYII